MIGQTLNINTAQKEELMQAFGLDEDLAQELVDRRPFYDWKQLEYLPGVNGEVIRQIKESGGFLAQGG